MTLVVHSDGAPIVRSSKKSIWPCFASITEIPPPMREFQSNIIILALWLSKKKPNVNIFLEETVSDLSILIHNGTSIFIRDEEYKIQLGTQFFVSDLPAKALFCCTTNFNGYSACTFGCSRGIWNPEYNKVLYPYKNNDFTARTHDSYLKAAREAIRKSNGGKEVAVDGIKAIKLLYSPQTKEEILFAERLLDFYCRTVSNVHDSSIEIFSLHAHLHLSYQVRQHGGLAHMSAFAFESVIRYIKKKAHGSINLGSQIAYWINIQQATQSNKFNLPKDCLMS
ncbi:unnamed protein product, partial [Rotaria sordida]